MQHLPRSTWLHTFQGTDPRQTILESFFYCDERIRCASCDAARVASRSRSRATTSG